MNDRNSTADFSVHPVYIRTNAEPVCRMTT